MLFVSSNARFFGTSRSMSASVCKHLEHHQWRAHSVLRPMFSLLPCRKCAATRCRRTTSTFVTYAARDVAACAPLSRLHDGLSCGRHHPPFFHVWPYAPQALLFPRYKSPGSAGSCGCHVLMFFIFDVCVLRLFSCFDGLPWFMFFVSCFFHVGRFFFVS